MTYDPEVDPRAIVENDEESRAAREQQQQELQEEITAATRVVAMFVSPGWQSVKGELYKLLDQANAALKSDELNTIAAVASIRGQIKVLEFLLDAYPKQKTAHLESLKQELQDMSANPD